MAFDAIIFKTAWLLNIFIHDFVICPIFFCFLAQLFFFLSFLFFPFPISSIVQQLYARKSQSRFGALSCAMYSLYLYSGLSGTGPMGGGNVSKCAIETTTLGTNWIFFIPACAQRRILYHTCANSKKLKKKSQVANLRLHCFSFQGDI